jgi:hypothetical protein
MDSAGKGHGRGTLDVLIKDPVGGNITIGSLFRRQWAPIDAIVAAPWADEAAAAGATTYHLSQLAADGGLQTHIERIDTLISDILTVLATPQRPLVLHVKEMNELYFSNPPSAMRANLYGAATNYKEHVDGAFKFPWISFYRALVGLTDGNTAVETYFTERQLGHKINKGDYIVFDFNRTKHKVIVEQSGSSRPAPRKLLKLHYLTFDVAAAPRWLPVSLYVTVAKQCYILYDHVTRALMAAGTDPRTYMGFFWGLICELYTERATLPVAATIFLIDLWLAAGNLKIAAAAVTAQWLAFVAFYWGRWKLTGRK